MSPTNHNQDHVPPEDWLRAIRDPDPLVRVHAIEMLSTAATLPPGTAEALAQALSDSDAYVREQAAWALHRIGEHAASVEAALLRALSDDDELVRRATAHALLNLELRHADANAAIERGLRDPSSSVRILSARLLWKARRDYDAMIPYVLSGIRDDDSLVKATAFLLLSSMNGFDHLSPEDAEALLADPELSLRPQVIQAIWQLPLPTSQAIAFLESLCTDEDPTLAQLAQAQLSDARRDRKVNPNSDKSDPH